MWIHPVKTEYETLECCRHSRKVLANNGCMYARKRPRPGGKKTLEKGEDESQRETNMVVQDWEEKIAEHLLLNACSFRGTCINVE